MTLPSRALLAAALIAGCGLSRAETPNATPKVNPFFTESTLPYGMPPFDRITDDDYMPAFKRGMEEHLREVEAIASSPEKPTFDNTIVALERSGRILVRVSAVFDNLKGCNTDDTIDKIDEELSPVRSAHDDEIHMNPRLFARVKAVYDARDTLELDPESRRLLEHVYRDFVRAGALLSEEDKAKLKDLNSQIATLQTTFTQNVLKEKNASGVMVADRKDLAGLTDAEVKGLEKDGKYRIPLVNTTGQPLLEQLENRALRQRIMEASLARGSHGGPFDNRAIVVQIARLRARQAELLGYPSFAAYTVEPQTAQTVTAVDTLLAQLVPAAVSKARAEAADMQRLIDREHGGFEVQSWDWAYYSEKVRKEKYSIDESQLRPYFELNRVLFDGVFFAANKLYGITFKERHDLPVYQPDVRVFEVFDADGSPLALLLEDFYARPSKQGGAWMNEYVSQSSLLGHKPVVGNHHNIPKPAPGEPTLLTFDEVTTLFHEFGHGLHGIFSHVRYPHFGGTNVPTDFVEYPSQVNEMWASWPEVVRSYAHHYKTGEPIPQALMDKMLAGMKFNRGYSTSEYVAATLLDQAWHELKPSEVPDDVVAFEKTALHRAGIDFAPVPPRYRSTYFSHSFSGEYAANYYAYLWADVLVADSVEWFANHGGLLRANGDLYRSNVLSRGGSAEAMDLFKAFTGQKPDVGPLIRRWGLDQSGN
jgi:peptidyl-dipeptidase Dcp